MPEISELVFSQTPAVLDDQSPVLRRVGPTPKHATFHSPDGAARSAHALL